MANLSPRRLVFGGISVDAPPDWDEISHDLEGADMPFTMAREDGVGALQFSIGLYAGGREPDFSTAGLEQMQEIFASNRDVRCPFDKEVIEDRLLIVATSFQFGEGDFMRVWHVSDRLNVAMITYVCEWGDQGSELPDCKAIVRSLEFLGSDA